MKMERIENPSNLNTLSQLAKTLGRVNPIVVNFGSDGIWKLKKSLECNPVFYLN